MGVTYKPDGSFIFKCEDLNCESCQVERDLNCEHKSCDMVWSCGEKVGPRCNDCEAWLDKDVE